MTTKTLAGTYTAGYTLSAGYSGLIVGAAASVAGTTGATGKSVIHGSGGDGGVGGVGVLASALVSVVSQGAIVGGRGGAGGAGGYHGGDGGAGGIGLDLAAGGSVTITGGSVVGGGGGAGGASDTQRGASGGAGGAGGAGIVLVGGGSIAVTGGAVVGGQGGVGGYGYSSTDGGKGGAGLSLEGGGSFTLTTGRVVGGQGGVGGPIGPHGYARNGQGGDGVALTNGGIFTNLGTVASGAGLGIFLGGTDGVFTNYGGTVINGAANDHTAAISGGHAGVAMYGSTVANYGTITGSIYGVESAHAFRGPISSVINGSATDSAALIYGGIFGVFEEGGVTLTNFGTIAAGAGARHVSVGCFGYHDRLIAEAGSTFVGAVYGGARGFSQGGNVLELAGGVGTMTGLGKGGTLSGAVAATISYAFAS